MKITLFIGGLSNGGAERVICNLANYLVNKKHDVEVLTISNEDSAYGLNKDIKHCPLIKGVFAQTPLRKIIGIIRFVKYLMVRKRDIYIVMLPQTTFMLLQMRFLTSAKIIAAQRIMPSSLKPQTQKQLLSLAYKADGWAFQTEEQLRWFGGALQSAKTIIIPNAVNPIFIQPPYSGNRKLQIISVGRMTIQKNQKLLIYAFEEVHKAYPDYKLIIYGEGPEKNNLIALVKKLNLCDSVMFPGFITNIEKEIKSASLFVLPSDFEGIPNALLEAMALGLPCISTDCEGGGARLLINNRENGLLIPKGDIKAMSNAIIFLLSQPQIAKMMGQNAHKVCQQYAPDIIYSKWEKFVNEVTCH